MIRAYNGPNMRHFWGRTLSYSFIVPVSYSDSLEVKSNLASNTLGFGYRYKLKMSEFFESPEFAQKSPS